MPGDVWCVTARSDLEVLRRLFDQFSPSTMVFRPAIKAVREVEHQDVELFRAFIASRAGVRQEELRLIVYVGRVMPEKNLHILLACIERARRRDPNIALAVVGAVVPRVPWDIETEATSIDYGLSMLDVLAESPGVVHLSQGGDELVDLALEAADSAVTLSCNRDENYGLGVREAERRGVPTIVSAWGGHLNDDHCGSGRTFIPVYLSGWGTHVDEDAVVDELLSVRRRADVVVRRCRAGARAEVDGANESFPVGEVVPLRAGRDNSSSLSATARQLKGGYGGTIGFASIRDITERRQSVYRKGDSRSIAELWEAYGAVRVVAPVAGEVKELVAAFGVRIVPECPVGERNVYRDDWAWASSVEVRGPSLDVLRRIGYSPLEVSGDDCALVGSAEQLVSEGLAYWREQ